MKKILVAFVLLASLKAVSQPTTTGRTCGTPVLPQQFEDWLQGLQAPAAGKLGQAQVQSVFNIPVIVHIIHNNEAVNSVNATSGNNLNAAQVIDQINILNKDFNGTNADSTLIPNVFKPLRGKFNVNFCLAVVNPTGGILAEPGIDRIDRVAKGWLSLPYSQNYINNTVKPNSIWNPNKYLNIWVCPLSGGVLGFATFPNPAGSGILGLTGAFGSATTDGVVILTTAFGSIGTGSTGQYNLGRTCTHEVGHWLGLRHIWGDGTCATDYCNDTPPAQTANYGCPGFPYKLGTCSGNTTGEMTMNFMDYTNDACMYMFTNDQKYRAQLILTNSPIRAALITSTVCNLPSVGVDAGISYVSSPGYSQTLNCPAVINPVINVSNFGSTALTSAVIAYNVTGQPTQTLNWSGNIAPNASSLVSLPQLTITSQGTKIYSVSISQPNGGADANLNNNTNNQSFFVSSAVISVSSGTTCPGVAATLVASGASSYSWNTGATGASISPAPLATTVFTVTGTSGACSSSRTVTLTVNPLPVITVNRQNVCFNTPASIIASGASTYTWSDGNSGASNVLTLQNTSTYTITGFNSPQCFTQKVVTITVNPLPTATAQATNLACAGCTNGSLSALAAGGTPPYTYIWTPVGNTSAAINDVGEGCYTVTVTDALGCAGEDEVCVSFDVGLSKAVSEISQVRVWPNPASGQVVVASDKKINKAELYDALGRCVLLGLPLAEKFDMDLSRVANGVYYLKLTSQEETRIVKLLKE